MSTKILTVGQLSSNCYLFYDPCSRKAFIIDPGDDADYIINKITDLALEPQAILATHGHFDHILAATELKLAYGIPFFVHQGDEKIVKRMEKTAKYFTGIKADPAPIIDKYLTEKDLLKIGNLSIRIIHTPGHTPGSVSFYCEERELVFTGDTVFADGNYGRTDLLGGDALKLKKSILEILSLPEDTIIYSGHGKKSSVKKEKHFYLGITNEFNKFSSTV